MAALIVAARAEFDFTGNGHGEPHGGYDSSFTALFGAMINKPWRFNSSGSFRAFGPWEQARGASFFPSVFDARSVFVRHWVTSEFDVRHSPSSV